MSINMKKRVKAIKGYYTSLKYNDIRKETLEKISTLSKELKFKDSDDFSYRFSETASLIHKNWTVFMAVCDHVDVITTIIDYFNHFGVGSRLKDESAENDENETVMCIMLTIYNIYKEHAIQLFLETAIIKQSQVKMYNHYKEVLRPCIKMILLEDSDMYAVINCLKIKTALFQIDEIWVQESIEHTFMFHLKKYFGYLQIPLYIFQSIQKLKDLFDISDNAHLNIASVWSEDIITAKNLAGYLKQDVLFINSYMDFCPGIVIPYTDIYFKSLYESFNLNQMDEYICTNPIIQDQTAQTEFPTFYLFYDGIWQKPKENTYWMHKNMLLAYATRKDIIACIESSTKGFMAWNNMSNASRKQKLITFATILESNGESFLANVIFESMRMSYTCGNIMTCFKTERFEVMKARKPQGTVILKETRTLFQELIHSLIIGNSVIVICNPDSFVLSYHYINKFMISGLYPGVINLLMCKNTENFRYDKFENIISETFETLTVMQHTVVACK